MKSINDLKIELKESQESLKFKKKHGGFRPGSGRKKKTNKKKPISIRLSPYALSCLEKLRENLEISNPEIIEKLIIKEVCGCGQDSKINGWCKECYYMKTKGE
jgi:hypothetical protein